MSAQPVSYDESHPPHGHPDNTAASTQPSDKPSTASHPPTAGPDPTTSSTPPHRSFNPPPKESSQHVAQGGLSTPDASRAAQLARLKVELRGSLRQFPDFPSPGILFEDIMPIFAAPALHEKLIRAFELQLAEAFDHTNDAQRNSNSSSSSSSSSSIDVIVGLESRGFLFGTTVALRLGAAFVPVRKKGKLPGPCERASFKKEYGEDVFEMQSDAIRPGQRVVVVDDIIATGEFSFILLPHSFFLWRSM
jgi:adenine phosphoribosyltransferase